MSLESNIKEWVMLDNQHRKVNEQVKNIREKKTTLSTDILNYVTEKQLSESTIKISDGKLNFVETKQTNPLTYKFLTDCAAEYFKDDNVAKEFVDFIKSKRLVSNVQSIKRLYNKE